MPLGQDRSSNRLLDKITDQAHTLSRSITEHGLTILYGPSFCIYRPCFVYDRLFSSSLRLSGAKIVPVYCDGIQSVECNYYGGYWKGSSFEQSCKGCIKSSKKLWKKNGIDPIPLSQFVDTGTIANISELVACLDDDEWLFFCQDGLPLGAWAKDILVNNWMVGDHTLIDDHERLGRIHLENLLILKHAYEKLLGFVKPDRLILNDTFYGMWGLLGELANRSGIPFYSYWPIAGSRVAMSLNDAAMNLDFRSAWPSFSQEKVDDETIRRVDDWLQPDSQSRVTTIVTHRPGSHQAHYFDSNMIDLSKPTALLAANVVWDLAALNKQIVFSSMMNWILSTIEWFEAHQGYQLIVRPHPVEVNPKIPITRERVESAINSQGSKIPDNVRLLSPYDSITVYELVQNAQVVLVHTSTVGFEMAARGLPVITTAHSPYRGFGFTFDPNTSDEYFSFLEKALQQKLQYDKEYFSVLAKKFTALYHFHYFMSLGLVNVVENTEIVVQSARELMPGYNPMLDYVMDSIMNGHPIISDNRVPPLS